MPPFPVHLNTLDSPATLNSQNFSDGLQYLTSVDSDLADIYSRLGPPPLWGREPGFATLVHIILEQQVSLASARAAFLKLKEAAGLVTPESFLRFDADELKAIGFSRQKAAYCRALAGSILDGEFDPLSLNGLEDSSARERLLKIKGIGPWTADIYLLMVLLRPNTWPTGDLALATAIQELKNLPSRPGQKEMEKIASPWQPWRSIAARQLWQNYLDKRGQL